MIRAQNDRREVTWWAALGAPLLVVPLLVGLLALAAPDSSRVDLVDEVEAAPTVDAVDVMRVDVVVEDDGNALDGTDMQS